MLPLGERGAVRAARLSDRRLRKGPGSLQYYNIGPLSLVAQFKG